MMCTTVSTHYQSWRQTDGNSTISLVRLPMRDESVPGESMSGCTEWPVSGVGCACCVYVVACLATQPLYAAVQCSAAVIAVRPQPADYFIKYWLCVVGLGEKDQWASEWRGHWLAGCGLFLTQSPASALLCPLARFMYNVWCLTDDWPTGGRRRSPLLERFVLRREMETMAWDLPFWERHFLCRRRRIWCARVRARRRLCHARFTLYACFLWIMILW